MSKHRKVVFISRFWSSDHPMLLRWKDYYESRGLQFIPLHVQWNLYYADRKRKISQIISLLRFLLKNRAFLLHANDLESGMVAAKMKRLFGIPFIYDAHEIYSHELPSSMEDEFHKTHKSKAEEQILRAANIVIIPNQQRIEFCKQLYSIHSQIRYILLENKSLTASNVPVNKTFTSLIGSEKSLFYGGSFWMGRKQEGFLLLAAALKNEQIQFVLSGSMNDYLQQLLTNGAAVYVGNIPVEEYNAFVTHIDIALAWYYPTTVNDELCAPLKIFDYLYAGKPVLAARLPYIEELANRFPGAIQLFEAGNWEHCFEMTKEMIKNYSSCAAAAAAIPKSELMWENQYAFVDNELKKAGINVCVE